MSGYSGHNTTGRGNEIAARRTRHNSFSSGSNNNAYPLNNEGVKEYRDVVKNTIYRLNKKAGNEWQKAHDNAREGGYPKATFKYNANRQKFEGKSTNKTNKKKKRKTVKKRLVKINNNNNNKNKKKNNKNSNKKRVTNKMNKTKMGGGRRRNTRRKRRKRRKRRGGMNPASSANSRRANGNNRANAARPNNQVIPVANTAQSNIDFNGNVLTGSNFNSGNSNSSNNSNNSSTRRRRRRRQRERGFLSGNSSNNNNNY